ncbi:hypothetical protein Tco_0364349 [Tanacetum coccineum]
MLEGRGKVEKSQCSVHFALRPFEILERIGPVAYRLRLLKELSEVHDTFHVSNLKKFLVDANLHVPLDEIKVNKTLHFVEKPVEIMDREVKTLKRSKIPIVKVRWNSKRGPQFTWEREDHMKARYPHLFVANAGMLLCGYDTKSLRIGDNIPIHDFMSPPSRASRAKFDWGIAFASGLKRFTDPVTKLRMKHMNYRVRIPRGLYPRRIEAKLTKKQVGGKWILCRREVMAKFLEWSSGQATWSGGQDVGVVPKGLEWWPRVLLGAQGSNF